MLTRVEAFDPIHAYFAISESDVLELMASNPATSAESLKANPPTIYMGLTGEKGFPHEGKLDFAEAGHRSAIGHADAARRFSRTPTESLFPACSSALRLPVGTPSRG